MLIVDDPMSVQFVLYYGLQGILENWTGIPLEPSRVYGIRRYKEGAWLMMHTDRIETHVVSAILQVC